MLCSRAITRERAAMSGSIAAFVLNGPLVCRFLLDRRIHHPRGLPGPLPELTHFATVNVELTSASNTCNAKSITCKVQFENLASLGRNGVTNHV